MPSIQPGETSKAVIYKQLRRAIIMGHLRPGLKLDVDELARKYGTSVTPVRDALQMLGQEGLVTIKSRSGYFVTHTTLKELRDLLDLREILEIAAVERAIGRITEEQLEQLAHVHAPYTGDDDESYDRYTDENRRFHYLLAKASGNDQLAETLGRLHDRLARFMVLRHAGRIQPESHARILEAIRQGDRDKAIALTRQELNATRDAILDRVMQEEAANWPVGAIR